LATILIIDDYAEIRLLLREMLEPEGYDVLEAPNAVEGMDLFRESPADVVIMDIIMPKKDGIEAIMDLKIEFPDVKIIAISGGGRIGPKNYLELARGFGASHIFDKPVKKDEILGAIKELLE